MTAILLTLLFFDYTLLHNPMSGKDYVAPRAFFWVILCSTFDLVIVLKYFTQ